MHNGEYGLGIDIGDGTVAAAVSPRDTREARPLPLGDAGPGPAALTVDDDGVRLGTPDAGGTARVLARVGAATPLFLGGRPVSAAAVVAEVVRQVRAAAAAQQGRPDAWTVVTVPPSWSGHRRGALAAALQEAGLPRFTLVSAAVAAVAAHAAGGELPDRPTVAVYDLGAATLDVAVVGPDPADPDAALPRHLAPPPAPLPWGGRDVDDLLVGHVRGCLTGALDQRAGAALRRSCVAAKEALAEETAVRVASGTETVRVTREELDELLVDPVRESAGRLRAAVEAAGLGTGDLDAVVLTGGGARIPLVPEVLSGELGRPLVLGRDPALTVALGAAGLAAEALAAEAPDAAAPATGTAVLSADAGVPSPDRRRAPGAPPRGPAGHRPAAGPGRPRARDRRVERALVVGVLLALLLVLPPALAGLLGGGDTSGPAGGEVPVARAQTAVDGGAVPTGGSPDATTGPTNDRSGGTGNGTAAARPRSGGPASDDPPAAPGTTGAGPGTATGTASGTATSVSTAAGARGTTSSAASPPASPPTSSPGTAAAQGAQTPAGGAPTSGTTSSPPGTGTTSTAPAPAPAPVPPTGTTTPTTPTTSETEVDPPAGTPDPPTAPPSDPPSAPASDPPADPPATHTDPPPATDPAPPADDTAAPAGHAAGTDTASPETP